LKFYNSIIYNKYLLFYNKHILFTDERG